MGNHRGAPLPTTSNKRWYTVTAPKGTTPLNAVLLSNGYDGFWSHWVGRTVGCTNTPDCPHCLLEGARWTGYIPALVELGPKRWAEQVLAITEGAARELVKAEAKYGSLIGLNVTLKRVKPAGQKEPKKNDPVFIFVNHKEPDEKLPPAFDVVDSVMRLYGFNEFWAIHMRTNGPAMMNKIRAEYRKGGTPHDGATERDPRRRETDDLRRDVRA